MAVRLGGSSKTSSFIRVSCVKQKRRARRLTKQNQRETRATHNEAVLMYAHRRCPFWLEQRANLLNSTNKKRMFCISPIISTSKKETLIIVRI